MLPSFHTFYTNYFIFFTEFFCITENIRQKIVTNVKCRFFLYVSAVAAFCFFLEVLLLQEHTFVKSQSVKQSSANKHQKFKFIRFECP